MKDVRVVLKVLLGSLLILLSFACINSVAAQGRPDIVWMQGGHAGHLGSVAFSPDGSLLASGSGGGGDDTIKIWRVSDGALLRTLNAGSSLQVVL